jgi:trafficking protein particle complex subunit 6
MAFDAPLPPYNVSDPLATFFNVSCLDLLLIEMVPLAERMARRAERIEAGELDVDGAGTESGRGNNGMGAKEREDGGGEVYRDALYFRLDALGYRVGQGLSERYVFLNGRGLGD